MFLKEKYETGIVMKIFNRLSGFTVLFLFIFPINSTSFPATNHILALRTYNCNVIIFICQLHFYE
jgi:hypothetical protein